MTNRISAWIALALGAAVLSVAGPGGGGETRAADLYVPAPPVIEEPGPVVYDWSGLYIGGHGGWSWLDSKHRDGVLDDTYKLKGDTFVGGVLGGINVQSGNVVYGLEGDMTFGNLRNGREDIGGGYTATFDVEPVGTIRARLGYAMDRTLLYLTAGLGLADADINVQGGPNGGKDSELHLGFVGGAGLEYAVTDAILLRAEYLYSDYGKKTYDLPQGDVKSDFEISTVRAGLSIKLNAF